MIENDSMNDSHTSAIISLGEDDIGELENAGLIGMEEINDYIDDLELEYENLKKNSILDEYFDSL